MSGRAGTSGFESSEGSWSDMRRLRRGDAGNSIPHFGRNQDWQKEKNDRAEADRRKLTWHSDSDSDDYGAPLGGAPKPGENRNNRVVVLKGMFSLEDLEKEPGLLIELKEEVREEAATLGEVTSVILYDVSVRNVPLRWLSTGQARDAQVPSAMFCSSLILHESKPGPIMLTI